MSKYVQVAVPLPLSESLTYQVPVAFSALARPGARVRVPVGRRSVVGLIMAEQAVAPEGIRIRSLESVLDHEPVLPEELVRLGSEAADYYLAPIGEVVHAMLPSDLPPWGDQRIWLSNAGALSLSRSAEEDAIFTILRERGRIKVSDLVRSLGTADLHQRIAELEREGRVIVSAGKRRGARYHSAVELAQGEMKELEARCGRSVPARQVVALLFALGRPATVTEITGTVGCSPGVVRRLISLGVLKKFTQIGKVHLDHHRLNGASGEAIVLRDDQREALARVEQALAAKAYQAFLLSGMTGSGKTEVYLRAAEKVLSDGGSIIVLVPEIALVPAVAGVARQRFGEETAIFHSAMSSVERQQEWERIRSGQARMVVGPRSAVFTPVDNLQLIVVDEEQDPAYKQDQTPRYHGRDLALLRAHRADAVVVLASATPSLETRFNVEVGKVARLSLTQRVGQGALPEGVVVDLRQEQASRRPGEVHFSLQLQEEMGRVLDEGNQIILLRNRRGYAPLLLCRACGEDCRCEECGLPRTLHRKEGRLRCHYCGSAIPVPRCCPACSEEALEAIGSGTERVEEQVRSLWPEVTVEVLDRDTARRGESAAVLERFGRGESQILVGTQMVSKGHHFPNVVLTAVLSADTYLSFPDFRAVEKTYNLLTQVSGRAGRGEKPGRIIIQTYHPEHYAIQAALRHDDSAFAAEEMRFRRIFHYPPYTRMIQLLLRDANRARGRRAIRDLADLILQHPGSKEFRVSGPAPAPFEKLRGKWRFQILLRHRSGLLLRNTVGEVLSGAATRDLVVDVDPQELL